ncbi:S-norcoclaurine synthase 1-like [Durio zibethinus]|uniref:S-norcoclaurine synthase 1-like n=1 Tax=Durio zibethinus TaxID=66656 RepID=A0A6P5WQF9_DURZI|nr:S-norcoclaurine synthase 1-like [Durio zibethinus]
METEVLSRDGFGGSLPVENVQALASKKLKDIPSRYIRPEVEFDVVSIDESLKIPVIDMITLGHDDEQRKLHLACKQWGFFQLINHGVRDEVIEKLKIDVQEFFKLPLEKKMACAQLPNNIEGYGQAFVVSENQKLDWGDMLFLYPLPMPLRNMRFWPTTPNSFRETLDKYSMELQKVTIHLLMLIAKNLGTDPESLASFFEDGTQGIRMNYYPPCAEASRVIGLASHSDATALTLLIQVNDVEGLQIKKNGEWVPVKPIPGAFIINIGDVIEIMSNGEYKSIEHRAVINPDKERLSIAAFHSPNVSTKIGPLPDLVKTSKAGYRTIPHEEFVRLTISSRLDGKGLLDQMKL